MVFAERQWKALCFVFVVVVDVAKCVRWLFCQPVEHAPTFPYQTIFFHAKWVHQTKISPICNILKIL